MKKSKEKVKEPSFPARRITVGRELTIVDLYYPINGHEKGLSSSHKAFNREHPNYVPTAMEIRERRILIRPKGHTRNLPELEVLHLLQKMDICQVSIKPAPDESPGMTREERRNPRWRQPVARPVTR